MPLINYINAIGKLTAVKVPAGLTVMHGAITNMVDGILAECGGAMTCATCHCYIDQAWTDKTGAAGVKELQKLRQVQQVQDNSRLSCQITVNEDLDGLIVYFPKSQVWSNRS